MVSSLRKCSTYESMKAELDAEILFLKDFGPDIGKSGRAHAVEEQPPAAEDESASAEDEDGEGTIELDLSNLSEKQSHVFLLGARASGL